jgi:hypothetical protein
MQPEDYAEIKDAVEKAGSFASITINPTGGSYAATVASNRGQFRAPLAVRGIGILALLASVG